MQSIAKNYSNLDLRLEVIGENIARLFKPTPRAKYSNEKQLFGYRFKDNNSMMEYLKKDIQNRIDAIEIKAQRKREQRERDKQRLASVKVGDVFCYSWGWEQTNVDFYQIVDLKGSSATVMEIGLISVDATGWASDRVKPDKDNFIGGEERVRLTGDSFKRSCGYAHKTNLTDLHHRSWYA